MKPATLLTFVMVTLIALIHVGRLIVGVEVMVAGVTVPRWVSLPGALLFGFLAAGLWREHARPA
ncbi:MAG TPA: hypothetical protein VGA22_12795 [Gemmatimonadales bacterium]|jgi:hypothetical protein